MLSRWLHCWRCLMCVHWYRYGHVYICMLGICMFSSFLVMSDVNVIKVAAFVRVCVYMGHNAQDRLQCADVGVARATAPCTSPGQHLLKGPQCTDQLGAGLNKSTYHLTNHATNQVVFLPSHEWHLMSEINLLCHLLTSRVLLYCFDKQMSHKRNLHFTYQIFTETFRSFESFICI